MFASCKDTNSNVDTYKRTSEITPKVNALPLKVKVPKNTFQIQ